MPSKNKKPKTVKKTACFILLTFLLLTTGATNVWAEEPLPPKLQKLTDEAYRCYSARETDNYFDAVKKVKDATEFSQYQETYYRACSYEAIYMFEYVDRQKGVQLAHPVVRGTCPDERVRYGIGNFLCRERDEGAGTGERTYFDLGDCHHRCYHHRLLLHLYLSS